MDIRIKGSSKTIRLNKNNFLSSGGEGQIFLKNNTIFKIYIDQKKAIPYSKIKELSLIQNKNVISPQKLLLNKKDQPIGYTMKYISNTYVLCQLFPRGFRDRENLSNDIVLKLVLKLKDIIEDIHKKNILIVDLNEMNFLVDKKFKEIYGIDVNSYQTQSFPATALMESVRDRHSSSFTKLTDWFSFGILSFQMFIGLHPYKGRYEKIRYPKDKGRELDERMLQNIPIFHKDVRYPKNVLPFDIIPQSYKNWFKAIFYDGKRVMPPSEVVEIIIVPTIIKEVLGNKDFDITKIFEYPLKIVEYLSFDSNKIAVLSNNDIYINNKKQINTDYKNISITPNNKIIGATILNNFLKLFNIIENKEITCNIAAEEVMSYNSNLFIKNKDTFSEIEFIEIGNNIQVVPKIVANVMENSTQIYDGTIIQNMLGRFIISIFPYTKSHYQLNIKELDNYRIIDAKYSNKVLIIIGVKKGIYDKFIFKIDDNFSTYSLRKETNISNYCGINFIVLDNGIVVHINENEELELFNNKKESTSVKIIDSNIISGDMKLFQDGVKVLFSKNKKLYRMRMK